jgi:hypothetical protein
MSKSLGKLARPPRPDRGLRRRRAQVRDRLHSAPGPGHPLPGGPDRGRQELLQQALERLPVPADERAGRRQLLAGGDPRPHRPRRSSTPTTTPSSSGCSPRRARSTAASREFEFSAAAQALYGFFWNDFCDWYVEVSKSKLQAEDTRANCLALQDLVLGRRSSSSIPSSRSSRRSSGPARLLRAAGRASSRTRGIEDASELRGRARDARGEARPGAGRLGGADEGVRLPGPGAQGRARRRGPARRPLLVKADDAAWATDRGEPPKLLRMAGAAEILRRRDDVDGAPAAVTPLGTLGLDLASAVDAGAERPGCPRSSRPSGGTSRHRGPPREQGLRRQGPAGGPRGRPQAACRAAGEARRAGALAQIARLSLAGEWPRSPTHSRLRRQRAARVAQQEIPRASLSRRPREAGGEVTLLDLNEFSCRSTTATSRTPRACRRTP